MVHTTENLLREVIINLRWWVIKLWPIGVQSQIILIMVIISCEVVVIGLSISCHLSQPEHHFHQLTLMLQLQFSNSASGLHCGMVVSTVASRLPGWGLSVWSLHVLPIYAWILSRYSGFLPLPKNMHVRLIGDSKLIIRLSASVSGCCLVCLYACMMDWRPFQRVPCLSPNDSWNRLPPMTLKVDGCAQDLM